MSIKNQMCFSNTIPLVATKSEKAILRLQVIVKVTKSLTLVSIKKALLVKYACQIQKETSAKIDNYFIIRLH